MGKIITVTLEDGRSLNLGDQEFVRAGGEGAVYYLPSIDAGVKIYHDDRKPIPKKKIEELRPLARNPDIIIPQMRVFRGGKRHVGHTFSFVPDTWVLTSIFPRSFRDREGVLPKHIHELVLALREMIEDLHREKILGVDLNEMNFLVPRTLDGHLYAIDVDSYQTPSYPATAIMDSIRDPLAKRWTEGSDWFSFAVLAFEMFIGIHPYKGAHPAGRMTFQERMKLGLSVFDNGVKLPPPCYPFTDIPGAFHAWLRAVFVDGKRDAPPKTLQQTATPPKDPVRRQTVSGSVRMETFATFGEPIREVLHLEGRTRHVVLGSSCIWVDGQKRMQVPASRPAVHIHKGQRILVWSGPGNVLQTLNLDSFELVNALAEATHVLGCEDRAYFHAGQKIYEVSTMDLPTGLRLQGDFMGYVLPYASEFFSGCIYQELNRVPHFTVYLGPGEQVLCRMEALEGHHILDAKYERGILGIVTVDPHHNTTRYVAKVGRQGVESCRSSMMAAASILNFTVLENGIAVVMTENGDLEIFSTRHPEKVNVLKDPGVASSLARLSSMGNTLVAFHNTTMQAWKMS